jgi:hypothetical protein
MTGVPEGGGRALASRASGHAGSVRLPSGLLATPGGRPSRRAARCRRQRCSFQAKGAVRKSVRRTVVAVSSCMERDSEPVAAAFRGCRSDAGADVRRRTRWSSSAASVAATCPKTPPLFGDAGSSDRLNSRPVLQRWTACSGCPCVRVGVRVRSAEHSELWRKGLCSVVRAAGRPRQPDPRTQA